MNMNCRIPFVKAGPLIVLLATIFFSSCSRQEPVAPVTANEQSLHGRLKELGQPFLRASSVLPNGVRYVRFRIMDGSCKSVGAFEVTRPGEGRVGDIFSTVDYVSSIPGDSFDATDGTTTLNLKIGVHYWITPVDNNGHIYNTLEFDPHGPFGASNGFDPNAGMSVTPRWTVNATDWWIDAQDGGSILWSELPYYESADLRSYLPCGK